MPADRVNLVNEDDAGRILLTLLEQVAYPAGTHANEHLDKIRAGNRKEGHVGFAGHCARQQSLAGSRGADEQHTFGDAPAELLKFLRLAQELDDLFQLFFGFVNSSNIFESDFLLLHGEQPGAALAEAQRLVAAGLHLPDHEEPESAQQQHRAKEHDVILPAAGRHVFHVNVDALFLQGLDGVRIVSGNHGVEAGVLVAIVAAHLGAGDDYIFHISLIHLVHERGEIDFFFFIAAAGGADDLIQNHQRKQNDHPNRHRLESRVHRDS